jgi:hypothetical protein
MLRKSIIKKRFVHIYILEETASQIAKRTIQQPIGS